MMAVIETRDLVKTYPAQPGRRVLFGRGGIASWFAPTPTPHQALTPLNLSVEQGESIGIIGRNGSGKSTLMKLIAGVTTPSSGTLKVRGRVASLLELGAGFHPMLTGRENIYLNAGLLGMRHAQTNACFEAIVDFSEIGEFIDQTVDTYSSGMYVRLAFSVAIHTNPDIFLVDEVLSVGDESFQRKCRARILELKEAGKTILFVSHDLGIVNTLCDRVLLLDRGEVISRGSAQDTIDFYLRQIGRASGVHRIAARSTEALFNHGRISLYHQQREITAPAGIKVQFFSMGQYHESTAAEWTLTKSGEAELEARGVLPRLPVTIYLNVRIDRGQVVIMTAWENHRPIDLAYVALQCFLPVSFTRWQFGTDTGELPDIATTDREWSNVVSATHEPGDCFLMESAADDPKTLRITTECTQIPLQLDNTDYMTQARLAHVTEAIPSSACPLEPARRTLATITLDPNPGSDAAQAARTAATNASTLESPLGTARLSRGAIEIQCDGAPLTRGLHLHVQLKIDGLWILSHGLQWDAVERDGETLRALGRSLRRSLTLTWSLMRAGDAFTVAVDLTTDSPLRLEEYTITMVLDSAYTQWEMACEQGNFESPEDARDWHHLNAHYAPGDWIRATAASAPAMTLRGESARGTLHPTALLADAAGTMPVLQLIGSPEQQGVFTLEPGRHSLVTAHVSIGTKTLANG